ncbi:unnamed protein product [Miscanthus lutarioriparius]|uniref:NAC domain-containing protein n=1 Tax=Miscanthus lutarioriparius TaxID=422564 RepID=A0A811MIV9_9POAL|nr:unnamed protein product [Miscanthus lutarioriparius]
MATNDEFRPTDEASVALLRGLRAKTVNRSFIHRADVCSAAPEELVADLQPVPGTDVTEDGYNSVWYIYCPKRYKNTRGKASGHRQRAVEPDGSKMCWHSEAGPKPVPGVPGATFCNFSYGRKEKEGASGRQRLDRMGWCMTEFDDTQGGGGDHVLCRVHRSSSSLAKRKFKSSSSSSKRKAAGDHPEAPPTKLIHDEQVQMQMQVQQSPATFFTNAYPTMPCYGYGPPQGVDPVTMVGCEDERGVQQPLVEPEYGGEFNLHELINIDEQVKMMVQQDPAAFTDAYPMMPACYGHGGPQGVDPMMFGDVNREHGGDLGVFNFQDLLKNDEWKGFEDFLAEQGQGLQQPCAEPAEQGCEFVVPGHVSVC